MFRKLLTLAVTIAMVSSVQAAPKVITATIGFAPGSGNEISFRQVAALVEKANPDVSFVIQNRPGADEIVALDYFFKLDPAKSDQLYILSTNNMATLEAWFPGRLPHQPTEMKMVTGIAKSPLCIVANINSKTNTPKELLARLKDTKDPITFGLGSAGQKLVFEFMMEKSNGNSDLVKSILYKGPGQVLQDLGGGIVEFAIIPSAVAVQLVRADKAKFIAFTSEKKLELYPNVPLLKDYIPTLNFYASWGIAMPIGTTDEQADYFRKMFVPVIRSKEAKEFFDANLMIVFPEEHNEAGMMKNIMSAKEKWYPYAVKYPLDK
jgi:tripartite-type tricarboxylate transporter receptor subunit TctC